MRKWGRKMGGRRKMGREEEEGGGEEKLQVPDAIKFGRNVRQKK